VTVLEWFGAASNEFQSRLDQISCASMHEIVVTLSHLGELSSRDLWDSFRNDLACIY
jgi:hypothetical protein